MSDPPLAGWEEDGALRDVVRLARRLGHENLDREVLPRLRRLSARQRGWSCEP